ncbi:MAG: hypothetical protein KGN33_04600 [Paracoccaceae bacterium]|nr:hypothetical protein [Paracoccaceae bacterium]
MTLPLWKIRRELRRFSMPLRDLPADLYNYFFATRTYDRTLEAHISTHQGHQPETARIVVFVIFPSEGLLPSYFTTLDYFRSKGYAPLVVSNLPLSKANRTELLERCWTLIERKNFGYDFGGYRDGVLSLAERLPKIERLVLINDSAWFPLPGARDWLDEAEAMSVDFVGASSHFATPWPKNSAFREMRWTYSSSHRNFHYGSFGLYIIGSVLCDPRFLNFWKGLRLSDKKKQTVRRGEIGLTQWILARGYSHGTTFDITHLDRDLHALETDELVEIARNLMLPDLPRLSVVIKRILAEPQQERADLINVILLAVARQGASYALARYAIAERGFSFLKKSPLRIDEESGKITLDILARIDGSAEILEEARGIYEKAWGHIPPFSLNRPGFAGGSNS